MVSGLCVLGCDRAVGASLVARGLLLALRARGVRVAPFKPVEVGCAPAPGTGPIAGLPGGTADADALSALARLEATAGPPPPSTYAKLPAAALRPPTALSLLEACGLELPIDLVNPFRYAGDLDPATAARLADRPIDPRRVLSVLEQLRAHADLVLLEGCGGPASPIGPGLLQLDLLAELGLPVLLVGTSGPGTVSRVLLALEAVTRRGLTLSGVVLSRREPRPRPEEAAYPLLIEEVAGAVIRGVLPCFTDAQLADPDLLAKRFAVHLDLDTLLASA